MEDGMKVAALLALAWGGTVAGAWFLGGGGADKVSGGETTSSEVERLRARVAELEEAAASKPALAAAPHVDGARSGGAAETAPSSHPTGGGGSAGAEVVPADGSAAFSLEGITTLDEASKKFMAFAAARLAEGEKGHLLLFKVIDSELVKNKKLEALFRSGEQDAPRVVYPWMRFVVGHEAETVAMTETMFKTMAEDPSFFSEANGNSLEIFTEGLGMGLPGAADEPTMERFRGYARAILSTSADRQPEAVKKQRRRVERLLPAWAPPLTSAQALEAIRKGGVQPGEMLAFLRRLTPDDLRSVEVVPILGPLLDSGDRTVLRALPALPLDDRTMSTLDQRVLDAAAPREPYWYVDYLRSTNRSEWARARPFFDAGFRRGGDVATALANSLTMLQDRPPPDYVRGVVDSYRLPEQLQALLKQRFGLR
jgi:hypothetical protein